MSRNAVIVMLAAVVAVAGFGALAATQSRRAESSSQVVVNPISGSATSASPATTGPDGIDAQVSSPAPAPTTAAPTTTASPTIPPTEDADRGAPPRLDPYIVAVNESLHPGKQLAVQVVEALTNYDADESASDIVGAIAEEPEFRAVLALRAASLLHEGLWSRGEVQYAQLGGHRNDRASVMVVVEQTTGSGSEVAQSNVRTVDVRVDLIDGSWQLVDIDDPGGSPIERPADLPPEAVAVLDDPRITLPDSAKWDIYEGHTSTTLLGLMSELADITPFSAVVLSSGHPFHVFETESVSNHSVGRAIDVYLLGDDLVIDNGFDGSPVHEIVKWLYDHPTVSQVGSPWNLDGPGRRSFTDGVHLDHLHIGVGS